MTNKLDLLVRKGANYSANTFSVNLDIYNRDTTSIALSSISVVSYGWFSERLSGTDYTIVNPGKLIKFKTLGAFLGQNGLKPIDRFNTSYTVTHEYVDITKTFPILSLNVPAGGAGMTIPSITNRTNTTFDIVLPESAPTNGYSVSWYLPAYSEDVTNGDVSELLNPVISFKKLSLPRLNRGYSDTTIELSWPNSNQTIPIGFKLENLEFDITDFYFETEKWYSVPTDNKISNKTFLLYQNDILVTEYQDDVTIDTNTGVVQDSANHYYLTATQSVYIDSSVSKNTLSNSNSGTLYVSSDTYTRRSIVKFDISSIPQTKQVSKAILRLNSKDNTVANLTISEILESWTESEVSWYKRNNGLYWTNSGGTLGITSQRQVTSNVDNWIDVDVTDIVNNWRIGNNNGLMLGSDNGTLTFSSTRNYDSYIPTSIPHLLIYSDVNIDSTPLIPAIKIISPVDGTLYSNDGTLNLVVSADTSINSVSAFKIFNNTSEYIGSLNNSSNWTLSTAVSSVLSAGQKTSIYVVGKSSSATYISDSITVVENVLPTFTIINPNQISTSGFTISAIVYDEEGYNSCSIQILSGTNTVVDVISSNDNGYASFDVSSTGTITLSAKIFESNPVCTGVFSIIPFTLNLTKVSCAFSIPYSNAKLGGTTIIPNVKVVPTLFSYTSTISVTGSTYNKKFWITNYMGEKYSQLIDSGTTLSSTFEGMQYVSMEIVTPFTSAIVSTLPVYIRKSIVDFNITGTNTCTSDLVISGTISDTDIPNIGIIDNVPNIGLYQGNTLIDSVVYDNDGFFSQAISPVPGTGVLTLKVIDEYGNITGSNTKDIGNIYIDTTPVNIRILSNVSYNNGKLYGVSGLPSLTLSADTTLTDITDYLFVITKKDGTQQIINSLIPSINCTIGHNEYINVSLTVSTRGGCVFRNDISIFDDIIPTLTIKYPSQLKCYCSSETFTVQGVVNDNGIYKDLFNENGITYTVDISAGFDTTIISQINDFESIGNHTTSTSTTNNISYNTYFYYYEDSFGRIIHKSENITPKITQSPIISFATPTVGINYPENGDIDFTVLATSGTLKSVKYYVNDLLVGTSIVPTTYKYTWTGQKYAGIYNIKAVGISTNNCVSNTISMSISVSNGAFVTILNKKSHITTPSILEIRAKVSSHIQIANVKYMDYLNNLYSMIYDDITDTWLTTTTLLSGFGARQIRVYAQDINGTLTNDSYVVYESSSPSINLVVDSTTIDLTSAFSVSAYYTSTNGQSATSISISTGSYSKDLIISNSVGIGKINAYELGIGVYSLSAFSIDTYNISGVSSPKIISITFTGTTSKPIIRNISNVPENKVSNDLITSVFEIYDYMNGIDRDSVMVTLNDTPILASVVQNGTDGNAYFVNVVVNKSGYVVVSGKNRIGVYTEYRYNNYAITCSTGRQINLTNYLPEYLQEDNYGNTSETKEFLGVFEKYLNSMYSNVDSSCNLSTLEKISRLQKLHDIDTIEPEYITNYSNLLGYKSGFNASEIGTFGYFDPNITYSDTTEEYMNKSLRFVVRNLPNWYSIKTTRNSLKIMLLSFGIIGDIMEYYTTDYDKDWYSNKIEEGVLVNLDIPETSYPTPHMSIGVNLSLTTNGTIYKDGQLNNVLNAMESIRPANVVLEGVTGIINSIQLPAPTVVMSFNTSKTINIEFSNQMNKY